ncbi:MAG: peptidoglycan DD-metalloendopeptidase family protein [Firmicutes bacterium]|nr:peptidoglycan DD-metalloendopeptidase family protein [Candidatus Colimorpha enterica]
MKKTLKTISVLLSFCLIFSFFSFFPSDNGVGAARITEADIQALKDKIANNKKKINEYSTSSTSYDGDIEEALAAKEKLDQQVAYTEAAIAQTEELIADYEALIHEKTEIAILREADVESKYDAFGQFLRASYENGKQSYLELLLSSENLIDFLTRADNLGSMLDYQKSIIEGIDDEIVELNRLKADLEIKKIELEATKESQKEIEKELETQLKNQEKVLKKLEADKDAALRQLQKANSAQSDLDAQLSKMLKQCEKQLEEDSKQALLWPVPSNVSKNRIVTSPYGWRDLYGTRDYHLGIDIGAGKGTSIYASLTGTVITAKYHYSYGNYIVVSNGAYTCLYAHCSSMNVKAGDKVTRGQVIGKVGCTGNAYGYHLHFEVWKGKDSSGRMNPLTKGILTIEYNGKWVDPVTTKGVLTIWK